MMAPGATDSGMGSRRASPEMDHDYIDSTTWPTATSWGSSPRRKRTASRSTTSPASSASTGWSRRRRSSAASSGPPPRTRRAWWPRGGRGFSPCSRGSGRSPRAGLALAALLAVLLLPGLFAWREAPAGSAGGSAGERRACPAASRRTGNAAALAARTAPRWIQGRARRLKSELAEEDADARAGLERRLAQAYQPQTNTPVLSLSAERGAAEGEPTQRVRLPEEPGLDRAVPGPRPAGAGDLPGGPARRRREVWRGSGLRPNGNDSLVVTLPSTLLEKRGSSCCGWKGRTGRAWRGSPSGPRRLNPTARRSGAPSRAGGR